MTSNSEVSKFTTTTRNPAATAGQTFHVIAVNDKSSLDRKIIGTLFNSVFYNTPEYRSLVEPSTEVVILLGGPNRPSELLNDVERSLKQALRITYHPPYPTTGQSVIELQISADTIENTLKSGLVREVLVTLLVRKLNG